MNIKEKRLAWPLPNDYAVLYSNSIDDYGISVIILDKKAEVPLRRIVANSTYPLTQNTSGVVTARFRADKSLFDGKTTRACIRLNNIRHMIKLGRSGVDDKDVKLLPGAVDPNGVLLAAMRELKNRLLNNNPSRDVLAPDSREVYLTLLISRPAK